MAEMQYHGFNSDQHEIIICTLLHDLFYYMSYTYYSFYVHIFDRSLVPDDFASRL